MSPNSLFKLIGKGVVVVILSFVISKAALGQSGTTGLSGTVADANDAPVPGATVTLLDPSNGFSRSVVTGDDGKFMPAQAKIEGETVIVSAEGVASPKTVRYGWQNDPKCTLYNAADLPAAPFEASR